MTITIAAVITTRNRASYAIAAVQSLLTQDAGLAIFVSDNSADAAPLREFCSTEPRVRYLRPSTELSMPEHWDWAIRQAMELSSASHFTIHYDRRISKPGIWKDLAAAESNTPDMVMTFPLDAITHEPPPLRLWQTPWTGKTFAVRTARVARLIADGKVVILSHALPVLANCIVPRTVLDTIVKRFGSVCNSNAPDTAFMARFLALYDQYIHFDRATGILYGSTRSNGLGYLRGAGGDFGDYQKLWGGRPWLDAAPFPGINLGSNILFNEYEIARRQTGDRLPPLDHAGVLNDLSSQLPLIADPQTKANLHRMLREQGWNGPDPAPYPGRPLLSSARQAVLMFLMRWFGVMPGSVSGFAFPDDDTALRYALQYPSAAQSNADHLTILEADALT
jgi:hypothetical protein